MSNWKTGLTKEIDNRLRTCSDPLKIKYNKICPFCKKIFIVPTEYRKIIFCSRTCSNKSRYKLFKIICLQCGKAFYGNGWSKKHRKFCSIRCSANYRAIHACYPIKNTNIELLMKKEFDELGLNYVQNVSIKELEIATIPDFVFFDYKVVVYCDGDYWHSFPNSRKRDLTQSWFLRKHNWEVLRFTGSEIDDDSASCADLVLWIYNHRKVGTQLLPSSYNLPLLEDYLQRNL